MDLFIENVKIIDPRSPHHDQRVNILIEKGKISKIGKSIKPSGVKNVWNFDNAHCSIGWLDIGTYLGEPGFEQRDTTESTIEAALSGGYTAIAPFPNTNPTIHSKSEVKFLKNAFDKSMLDCYPIGAISQNTAGEEIAEMEDMHQSGAKAFSDGHLSIQNGALLSLALQYSKRNESTIIHQPMDKKLRNDGLVHEGKISTEIGTRGIPTMAETAMVSRDLKLAEYADANLLVHCISSAESIKLIKEAKKIGTKVKSSVPYLNLIANDTSISAFDENYKVEPPLRSETDRKELLKAVLKGDIEIITANHRPVENEAKDLEFDRSAYGALGLQTMFGALGTKLSLNVDISPLITAITTNAYEVLSLDAPQIEVGAIANLTIFDPEKEWTFTKKENKSLSNNSPFMDKALKGKVLGVINNNKALRTN